MPSWLNRAKMTVSGSPGTGTVTLGSAVAPYQSFSGAGAVDGSTYSYVIEEGSTKFECGHGVYTLSGTTMSRVTVFDSSAGFGTKESFTSAATIFMAPLTQDPYTAGKNQMFIPAAAMAGRLTNPPVRNQIESATNKLNSFTWDFDPTTNQYLQFAIGMPKSWNLGTLTWRARWRHPAATTNFAVVWGLQAVALRNAVLLDQAFGTAIEQTSTGGTTDEMFVTSESGAMTVAGTLVAQDWVQFQFYRNAASGSDTLAQPASFLGLDLYMTTSAENDA